MKLVPNPGPNWATPAFEVIHRINHEALQWQISEALKELSDEDWAILRSDPTLETDLSLDVIFFKVYDRILPPDVQGCVFEFDRAVDAEVNRQLAPLLAVPVAA
jgi:hypothetical protein